MKTNELQTSCDVFGDTLWMWESHRVPPKVPHSLSSHESESECNKLRTASNQGEGSRAWQTVKVEETSQRDPLSDFLTKLA